VTEDRQPQRRSYPKGVRRRQQILDSVIAVLAQRGVDRASLRTVGEAIGVSHTALRHYFSSRDELLVAAYRAHEARADGDVPPADESPLGPIVDSLRSIAPIAWIPMALLWLGIRGNAALFIVAYAAFFPFVLNTIEAVRQIDRTLINAARALGASRALILRTVIMPGSLPVILTGARISLAFAWGSIIAAELAMGIKVTAGGSAAVGLGQLMVSTLYIRRDVNGLVLYMIVIGMISWAIDILMRRLQRTLTPWR